MATLSTKPIRTLHEHTVALEAAITVALANPRKSVVHKLRSGTRRIEAQLLLLDRLTDLPPHRKQEAALRRELKRLRRAAAEVRDLDVHAEHLTHLRRTLTREDADTLAQREGIDQLLAYLAQKREKAAAKLVDLLGGHQVDISVALEALNKALKPADNLTLPVTELLQHARELLAPITKARDFSRLSEDRLHTLRKSAKAARYVAESSPRSKHALAEGTRFETLQDTGGRWHDTLALTELARKRLGRSHPLSRHLKTLRKRHYDLFLAALQAHEPGRTSPPPRSPSV